MSIRFLTAGVFLIAAFSSNAYALSIAGWGFKIGSLEATINLRGVPNPDTKPTVAIIEITDSSIEIMCTNPTEKMVAPGEAGFKTKISDVVDPSDLDPNTNQKGQATLYPTILLPEPFPCVNENWNYVYGSAAFKHFDATISYFYCSGEDPYPCSDTTTFKGDVINVSCTVKDLPIDRYSDGTVVKGQEYECTEK